VTRCARLHAVRLLRLSGGLAALGLGAALLLGRPAAALVGFGCVGLGMANVVPILFSAAGRAPGGRSGTGVAAVASAGYGGFLVGPPLSGFAARLATLPVALWLEVLCIAAVALGARTAGYADAREAAPAGED